MKYQEGGIFITLQRKSLILQIASITLLLILFILVFAELRNSVIYIIIFILTLATLLYWGFIDWKLKKSNVKK